MTAFKAESASVDVHAMVAERRRVALIVLEPDPDVRVAIVRALNAQVVSLGEASELVGRIPAMPTVVVLGPSVPAADRGTLEWLLPPRQALRLLALGDEASTGEAEVLPIDTVLGWPAAAEDIAGAVDRLAAELVGVAAPANGLSAGQDLGHLTTVFAAKGGSGTSVVATNLAAALAETSSGPVVLVDADFAAGDVAVMLGMAPDYTLFDATDSAGPLDPGLLERMLALHGPSGVFVLAAPFEPAFASRISSPDLDEVLQVLRRFAEHVVVDTSVHIDDRLLTILGASDDVILVAGLEVPSVKGLTIGLQILALVDHPPARVQVVVNRANAPVGLSIAEIEHAVGVEIDELIPSDIVVPLSLNDGRPILVAAPDHPVSHAFRSLAASVRHDDSALPSRSGGLV